MPTAVPSTYTVTVLFASAVPVIVGWLLLVTPSLWLRGKMLSHYERPAAAR
ncbi:hypothetical protein [Chromobacterium phragmitis]|uniref:hypothetical protein n=1 Tax=Chromobacterium phragmitis TaxID=2202141 RepID=UPI0032660E74